MEIYAIHCVQEERDAERMGRIELEGTSVAERAVRTELETELGTLRGRVQGLEAEAQRARVEAGKSRARAEELQAQLDL